MFTTQSKAHHKCAESHHIVYTKGKSSGSEFLPWLVAVIEKIQWNSLWLFAVCQQLF